MWNIKASGFHKDQIIHRGNQFLIGHLKLGVRGTMDEFRKSEMVAINLPMVYDQVGDGWRESVNAFNPLYTTLWIQDNPIDLTTKTPIHHEQNLSLKDGVMSRHSVFEMNGIQVEIKSSRFVSMLHERVILGTYEICVNQDVVIDLFTGVDVEIWDIHGPHLEDVKHHEDDYIFVHGITHELKKSVSCLKKTNVYFNFQKKSLVERDGLILEHIKLKAQAGQSYRFDQYGIIGVDQSFDELIQQMDKISQQGYQHILMGHQKAWLEKWKLSDVIIHGDDQAQLALRYSIYHLLILSPDIYLNQSIPARGISGQTYKGAVFWDTEIFMLPFYLNTNWQSARQIIMYRVLGLKGAKKKAEYYGFKGAFYAWESQENGQEACSDYNVIDVFTNRPTRTYFRDKQIHISADIVYAMHAYIQRTQDFSILKDGGLEMLIEIARFYMDYGHFSIVKNRLEFWDVLGPDEYHERVHNNAFTNQMIYMVFETLLSYERYFEQQQDPYFDQTVIHLEFQETLELLKTYYPLVYLQPVKYDFLIEQFDGYDKLKDMDIKSLLDQRLHPNEYLGGHGLAGDTKMIKQADVMTMLYLFADRYPIHVIEANFNYYEPRTEHGSSLSASMYALCACRIGKAEYAYPLFMKSATIDLTGQSKHYAGNIYIGGTHPAASGGAYMTAVYGFTGLHIEESIITVKPNLPESFQSMSYHIKHQDKIYHIYVSKDDYEIKEINYD